MREWMSQSVAGLREWSRRVDLVVLLGVLVLVGGTWGFLSIARTVLGPGAAIPTIDTRILRAFRDPHDPAKPIGPVWMEEAVRDVTGLGSAPVLGLMVAGVLGFLLTTRKFHTFWLVLAASVGGVLLSQLLKGHYDRPRPSVVVPLTIVHSTSFPSAHAQMSAVIYLTLGAIMARLVKSKGQKIYLMSVALLLTLLVGVSRIYLGVHYPSDVLAGWTAGLTWAVVCWLVARALQKRHAVENVDSGPET